MHRARIQDEVAPCPWMSKKELGGQHVGFEPIAGRTRRHDVARRMGSALGERMNVIERGTRVLEGRSAVHASAAAVSHRSELERSLVLCGEQPPHPTKETSRGAGCAGEGDAMTVSSGQSHLAGKDDTPRRERLPRAGCRASWSASHRRSQHVRHARRARIVRWVLHCRDRVLIGLRVRRVSGRAARYPLVQCTCQTRKRQSLPRRDAREGIVTTSCVGPRLPLYDSDAKPADLVTPR